MKFLLAALVLAALAACAGEEAPLARETAVPSQQRDPEARNADSASVGASATPSREGADALPPRGATDLGREAEKEEEEIRRREQLRALEPAQR